MSVMFLFFWFFFKYYSAKILKELQRPVIGI